VFDLSEITFDKNWGNADDTWSDTLIPEQKFIFYCNKTGNIKIDVITEDTLNVKHIEFVCEKGLNFYKYDLSVDADKEELYLNNMKDRKNEKKTHNSKVYLRPGKYTVKFELNGVSEEKTFEIKDQSRKRRK
jgi:hypothetical protein